MSRRRWEYHFELFTLSTMSGAKEARLRLNELGAEGWELVSLVTIAPVEGDPGVFLKGQDAAILKREVDA